MKCEMTLDDIKNSKPRDCEHCPIATVLRRTLKRRVVVTGAGVGKFIAIIDGGNFPLPQNCADFIKKYDFGHPVEPITFDLEYLLRT